MRLRWRWAKGESTQPAPNNSRETRAVPGSLLLENGGFTQRGRGFFFLEALLSLRPRRESGLGAVGGIAPLPFPGESPCGGGGGRWGAPALHAWSRLRPRPTTQGPDPKPVAVADGVFCGPKLCWRWDRVHGAGRGEARLCGKEKQDNTLPAAKQPRSVPVSPHRLDPWGHSVLNRGTVCQRQWEADSPLRASCGISPCIGNWQRLGRRL